MRIRYSTIEEAKHKVQTLIDGDNPLDELYLVESQQEGKKQYYVCDCEPSSGEEVLWSLN